MGGRALGIVRAMAAVSAVSVAVPALPQFALLGEGSTANPNAPLKGKPAVDLIPGIRRGLGYPLRNDNVVPGTAEVFVNGRQYLVIACGGGKLGTKSDDAYVAFALPPK